MGRSSAAPVKARRVIDQQPVLKRSGGRHFRDEIDQRAIVRHMRLHVGMRPIGPPQDPVGEGFDDPPGKRYDVLIVRRTTLREPVGAAHFRPDVGMLAHQLDEQFDIWSKVRDRKSTRLNSSHVEISYAVFCLKKKKAPRIILLPKIKENRFKTSAENLAFRL